MLIPAYDSANLSAINPATIAQAASLLAQGKLLGLPTETVYGLAARADDDDAVKQIFTTKGRPSAHPLIVHVASAETANSFAAEGFLEQIPDYAAALMRAFWPGPLTVIVPRRSGMAEAAAGQHPAWQVRPSEGDHGPAEVAGGAHRQGPEIGHGEGHARRKAGGGVAAGGT